MLAMPEAGWDLIRQNDGPFKSALDHTKYATRYPDLDVRAEQQKASAYMIELNERLEGQPFLLGACERLADHALFPFVRQFANIDRAWFDAQDWPNLGRWLRHFTENEAFSEIMQKIPTWQPGDPPVWFGS